MTATRTYNYRNTKVATIWILVAISCIIAIVTLYNQAVQARNIMQQNASSAVNMVAPLPTAASQQVSCYDGGAPVYDPAKCAVPTATAN
jgi:hypothetical protein